MTPIQKRDILHPKIENISDHDLLALIEEIHGLRKERKEGLVIHYLIQSLHPPFKHKIIPINKSEFKYNPILQQQVKKLPDILYHLCIELVDTFEIGHIENHDGSKFYVFLNRAITDTRKRKKKEININPADLL